MKLLKDMPIEELQALYKVNQFLRDQVAEEASEQVNFWIDEVLTFFRGIRAVNYNIGYPGNYFTFLTDRANSNEYREFFEACNDIESQFAIFSVESTALLKRVTSRIDFLTDSLFGYEDISNENQERITEWIDKKVIPALSPDILKYLANELDFQYDEGFLLNDILDIFAQSQGGDYETDGTYIYETTRRQYA